MESDDDCAPGPGEASQRRSDGETAYLKHEIGYRTQNQNRNKPEINHKIHNLLF